MHGFQTSLAWLCVIVLCFERWCGAQDVFLRELVSNAADACDKKRFLAVSEGKGAGDDLEVPRPPSCRHPHHSFEVTHAVRGDAAMVALPRGDAAICH